MAWNNAVVTNAGVAMLQQVLDGATLIVDGVAGGSGTVAAAALMAQTSLKTQKQTLQVVNLYNETNGKKVNILITNIGLATGYTMNQVGIWAHVGSDSSTLFAILQDETGIAIPSKTEIPEFALNFYAVINFSNSSEFSFSINPSALVSISMLNTRLAEKLDTDGNGSDVTAAFTQAATRTNISTGEKMSVLFGKIMKFFADIKTVAFTGKLSDISEDSTHRTVTDVEKSTWSGKQDALSGDVAGHYHSTDRNRANHTGTQSASTISDFAATVRATVLTGLSTGTNAVIAVTDTVLSALGKLQKQITDNLGTLTSHTGNTNNPHAVTKAQVGLSNVTNDAQIPVTQKGAANGVAELDASGKVLAAQLPSFVDDVLEAYTRVGQTAFSSTWLTLTDGGTALTPESGKIYIILSVGDYQNKAYRWSGSAFVEISQSLALGETSSTAYRGDRGKAAYDHISDNVVHITGAEKTSWNGAVSHISDAVKHVTAAERTLWNTVSNKVDKVTGKQLTTEDYTTDEKNKLAGISAGANNYTHPSTHPASIIVQDASNRFVTDSEKSTWNAKASTAVASTSANGLMSSTDKSKLDGIAAGAQVNTITSVAGKTGAVTLAKADVGLSNVDNVQQAPKTEFDTHLTDYIRQPGYGTTAGSANAYTLTLSPALSAYTAGVCVAVKIHAANTGASTININGLGAKSILDSKGNAMTSGKLKAGIIYTLRYDGTNFISQGEGGEVPKLPNLIKNGSFENDSNCWINNMGSISSSGAYFGTKCFQTLPDETQVSYAYVDVPIPNGHKVYVTGMFCPVSYTSGSKSSIGLSQYDNWEGLGGVYVDTSKLNIWQRLSYIVTAENGGIRLFVGRGSTGVEVTKIDGVMLFDLTDAFGAGNEPTQEEINEMVMRSGRNLFEEKWRQGDWNDSIARRISTDCPIFVQKGKTYVITSNSDADFQHAIALVDAPKGGNLIDARWFGVKTFSSTVDCWAFPVLKNTADTNITVDDIAGYRLQIEEGTVATPYEPYLKHGWWDSDLPQLTDDANATADKMLIGSSGYAKGKKIDGNIPIKDVYNPAIYVDGTATQGRAYFLAPKGYYDGSNMWVHGDDSDFIPENFLATKNVFGLQGNILVVTTDQNATARNLWDGDTNLYLKVPKGYWDGNAQVVTNDPNFKAANIPAGMSMFNLAGTNTNKKWASGSFTDDGGAHVIPLSFTPNTVIMYIFDAMNGVSHTAIYTLETGGGNGHNIYKNRIYRSTDVPSASIIVQTWLSVGTNQITIIGVNSGKTLYYFAIA